MQNYAKIKVLYTGRRGEFSNSTGSGIPRYMYEIFRNVKRYKSIDLQKIEYTTNLPILSRKFPYINGLLFGFRSHFDNFNDYDILHNLDPSNLLWYNFKKHNIVVVSTIHDLVPVFYRRLIVVPNVGFKDIKQIFVKASQMVSCAITSFYLKQALKSDFIIVNSSQTKKEVIKFGYDPKRIFVVNLGVEKTYLKPPILRNPEATFKVGYLGGLGYKKNISFAIKAFRKIKTREIKLEIWGNKTIESDILLKEIGKDDRITLMGFAPEKNLIELLDSFDVFVFPSLHEGFGLPILEAQARGVPVIIYKNARIPEEITRYCIKAKDETHMAKLIQTIRNKGYNKKMKRRAMKYARSFTWEKTAGVSVKIYKKIWEDID